MNTVPFSLTHLSDQQLLTEIKRLAGDERQATARLIASLAELDARRLYLGEGCSSLFTYCTHVLHLSEHAAYGRIEAARTARRFPVILERLADGSVTLTTVGLLAPHLTPENHQELLDATRHKRKRDVEHLVAHLAPRADVPTSVRKLPTPKALELSSIRMTDGPSRQETLRAGPPDNPRPPTRPAVVSPVAPERYQIKVTVGRETYDKLCHAKDLLRHTIPSGDAAAILDRALTLLVADLEKTKVGATARRRAARPTAPGSRHIPSEVKRAVWARDGGQCAFVGTHGRCLEKGFLEFHHVVPFSDGGRTEIENLQLRCKPHNGYEAEQYFGDRQPWLVREHIATWQDANSVQT